MIGRLLRHPLPYLLLLAGLSHWRLETQGGLTAEITNDTQGYEHLLDAESMAQAMAGLRTYGYPLIIRIFDLTRDGWSAVPRFHFAAYSLAVFFFWWAVSRFTRSRWLAFAAAAPLFLVDALHHVKLVVTDSIAETVGLMVVALLLLLAVGRRRALIVTLLGMAVFLAYFIRPIYQFLIVLVPLLGVLLRLCHEPRERPAAVRWTVGLAVLTLAPMIAFSSLRLVTVGHFSVSTFSGYHLGSLGAMMLDDALVTELPADLQPLAGEILEARKARGLQPMRPRSPSKLYQGRQFGLTMFNIVEPIATRVVAEEEGRTVYEDGSTDLGAQDITGIMGPTAMKIDERLVGLGKAAIRARPLVYFKWIRDSIRLAVMKALAEPLVPFLLALLALSIPVFFIRSSSNPLLLGRPWRDRVLGVFGLVIVAVTYFLGHSMIVALIHWPKDRYAAAANLLLPSALAAGLFELWRWIAPSRPRPMGRARSGRVATAIVGVVLCLGIAESLGRLAGLDFDRQRHRIARIPVFHRYPSVASGSVFYRRAGPEVWNGRVLAGANEVEVRYDAHGFRNPPGLDDWEVVVTGDGFVEAGYLPDEEIFTSILARQLGAPVKNLGVNHTGTLTQIHYLETWGRAAGTRDAVLAFNEGDDLRDLASEGSAVYRYEQGRGRSYRWIVPQSSLTKAVIERITNAGGGPRVSSLAAAANATLTLPGREPERVRVFQRVPGPRGMPAGQIEQLAEVVRRWAASSREMGLRPWIVYLPTKHRILQPYLEYDEDVDPRIRNWKPTALPRLMERLAAAQEVGFIDAEPRLASATARGQAVYNPIDVHLSIAGSRHVGRLLAETLRPAD